MSVKIGCGQMQVLPGRPDLNAKTALDLIERAKNEGVDILLLPEMCIPGYLIGDLWEQSDFLSDCEYYTQEIAKAAKGITVIFGNVAVDGGRKNSDGHARRYNAAFAAQNGKLLENACGLSFTPKTLLPEYREFDDARYFTSYFALLKEEGIAPEKAVVPLTIKVRGKALRVGIFLCEDGWTDNYPVNIPEMLAKNGCDLLCNLSCSPFTLGKDAKRHKLFGEQAKKCGAPLVYCNMAGVQNNGKNIYVFDGQSCVYDALGKVAASSGAFREDLLVFTFDDGKIDGKIAPDTTDGLKEDAVIYRALRYGAEKFLEQCRIKHVAIGISGGIDSAVSAGLFTDILGPENVLLINMPSRHNSATTKDIAKSIAENLGCCYAVMPITESLDHTVRQMTETKIHLYKDGSDFNLELTGLMKENIQARDRGSRILACAAAAFGGGFICNANKSEITVGYGTFYGDIAGLFSPLGDLWKHQVYALARYLNGHVFKKPPYPDELFTIRPSAELSDQQTVGNGGDPLVYEYHDYLFGAFMESWNKVSPGDILEHYAKGDLDSFLGCEEGLSRRLFPDAKSFCEDLERWYKLYTGLSVAKRIQAPPVVSISRRAYGFDFREAQMTTYLSRKYLDLKEKLLTKK